jgi:hypothetical protein
MNEEEAKSVFSEYLKRNGIDFFAGKKFLHSQPDFVFKKENFWYCVEVKGEESNIIEALGEVINYFTDFSHVFLCAPMFFLDRFIKLLATNPELESLRNKLGIILVNEKQVVVFKEAKNKTFYCHDPATPIKRSPRRKIRSFVFLDETDLKILDYAREKPVFIPEAHLFGLSYQRFYNRLKSLEKQGYLRKATQGTNPVPFVRTEKQFITF